MISKHAAKRAQQRGMPPFVDEMLDRFGRETYDGRGGLILHFDKQSRRRMEREMGRGFVRLIDGWLDAYKVISATDGTTITYGKRYKRVLH